LIAPDCAGFDLLHVLRHDAHISGSIAALVAEAIEFEPVVEPIRSRGRVWRYRGRAVVDGTLVARAEFSAAIVETACPMENAEP